jgi:hypothetical protein
MPSTMQVSQRSVDQGKGLTKWLVARGILSRGASYHNGANARPTCYQSHPESEATRLKSQANEAECVNCDDEGPKCGGNIRSLFQNA